MSYRKPETWFEVFIFISKGAWNFYIIGQIIFPCPFRDRKYKPQALRKYEKIGSKKGWKVEGYS